MCGRKLQSDTELGFHQTHYTTLAIASLVSPTFHFSLFHKAGVMHLTCQPPGCLRGGTDGNGIQEVWGVGVGMWCVAEEEVCVGGGGGGCESAYTCQYTVTSREGERAGVVRE